MILLFIRRYFETKNKVFGNGRGWYINQWKDLHWR